MEQLLRRMVFNLLVKNQNDHVKNIPFLMDRKGQWHLAPAYDMTLSYLPGHRWLGAHQMSINGKRTEITEKDLMTCGGRMDLTSAKCCRIIQQTMEAVSAWESFADQAFVPSLIIESVKELLKK